MNKLQQRIQKAQTTVSIDDYENLNPAFKKATRSRLGLVAIEKLLTEKQNASPKAVVEFESILANLLDHKKLDFNGQFRIAPGQQPTSTDVEKIFKLTTKLHESGQTTASVSMWVMGNILYILRDYEDTIAQFASNTDYAISTLTSARRTYEFFKEKKFKCSFTHHKEVAHMRDLPNETKILLIQTTADEGWSVATMRTVGRHLRHEAKAGKKLPTTTEELLECSKDATMAKSTPTKQYLQIADNGKWDIYTEQPTGEGFIAEIKRIISNPRNAN